MTAINTLKTAGTLYDLTTDEWRIVAERVTGKSDSDKWNYLIDDVAGFQRGLNAGKLLVIQGRVDGVAVCYAKVAI